MVSLYHPDETYVQTFLQGGPLPVINGVITPTNGLKKMGLPGVISPYL